MINSRSYKFDDKGNWFYEGICAVCGDTFRARRFDAKTCSDSCRNKASRRKKAALADLQYTAHRARQIAKDHRTSQQVYDQMVILYKSIGNSLDIFETEWKQQALPRV